MNISTKARPIKAEVVRLIVLITEDMDKRINEISEAMSLEKAATARMLLNFAVRFADPFDLTSPGIEAHFKNVQTISISTRITQETFNKIEDIVKAEGSNKSAVTKRMLAWALDNIVRYSIGEWVDG